MKRIIIETETGFATTRKKLGTRMVNLRFTFNIRDGHWYLTIPGVVAGMRVVRGVDLYRSDEGYLRAYGDVQSTRLEVRWHDYTS